MPGSPRATSHGSPTEKDYDNQRYLRIEKKTFCTRKYFLLRNTLTLLFAAKVLSGHLGLTGGRVEEVGVSMCGGLLTGL